MFAYKATKLEVSPEICSGGKSSCNKKKTNSELRFSILFEQTFASSKYYWKILQITFFQFHL